MPVIALFKEVRRLRKMSTLPEADEYARAHCLRLHPAQEKLIEVRILVKLTVHIPRCL